MYQAVQALHDLERWEDQGQAELRRIDMGILHLHPDTPDPGHGTRFPSGVLDINSKVPKRRHGESHTSRSAVPLNPIVLQAGQVHTQPCMVLAIGSEGPNQ